MKIKEVIRILEDFAPLGLQENYDNAGLVTGDVNIDITGALCTIDVTEEVIDEAINLGTNLIISHHPVIYGGLKSLTGKNYTERVIIKAIRNSISLFSSHTNLDNVKHGVNSLICNKLGLSECEILSPLKGQLFKLVTFVPVDHAGNIREALFNKGAGHIGNYDNCSYNIVGQGTFRPGDNTSPYVGEKGKIHIENEIRIECIVPKHLLESVINGLLKVHPYEEVAYDVYPLENTNHNIGAGMIGQLKTKVGVDEFLSTIKKNFHVPALRYSDTNLKQLKTIAVCGGSGSFLIDAAKRRGADAFITSDIKYHQYFETENLLLLCDIGHYESEQFTKEIFYDLLTKNFSTFAVHLSRVVTNPIKYFL